MGYCLEAHDLAASKLAANREKDLIFVTVLLDENLVDPATLLDRIEALPVPEEQQERMAAWVKITCEDLG